MDPNDYINLQSGSTGYPPHPGEYANMPKSPMGCQSPQAPPLGYAYPPAAKPVQQEQAPIITTQPKQLGHGTEKNMPLNVPPGLECLTRLGRLIVTQKEESLGAFLRCTTNNTYKVSNSHGRELYTAKEDTGCCIRNICETTRPFDMKIKDMSGQQVIHLLRPLACQSCCFPCCLQRLEVFAPPGQLAGTVTQEWSLCQPQFVVKDAQENVVFIIEGPLCTISVCGSVTFQIFSRDGSTKVGTISNKLSDLLRKTFTDADNFCINFPMELDVRMKAVMLGAGFLIDSMFFEKTG